MTKDSSQLNPSPDTESHDDQPRKPRGRKKASAAAEKPTGSRTAAGGAAKKTSVKAAAKAEPRTKRAASAKTTRKSASDEQAPEVVETQPAQSGGKDFLNGTDEAPVKKATRKKASEKKNSAPAKKTARQPRKKSVEPAATITIGTTDVIGTTGVTGATDQSAASGAPAQPAVASEISSTPSAKSSPKSSPKSSHDASQKVVRTPRTPGTKAKSSAGGAKSHSAEPLPTPDHPSQDQADKTPAESPRTGRKRASGSGTDGRRASAKNRTTVSNDIPLSDIAPDSIAPAGFAAGSAAGSVPVAGSAAGRADFETADLKITPETVMTGAAAAEAVAPEVTMPEVTMPEATGPVAREKDRDAFSVQASFAHDSSQPAVRQHAEYAETRPERNVGAVPEAGAAAADLSGESLAVLPAESAGAGETSGRTRRPRRRGGRGRRKNNAESPAAPVLEGDGADSGATRNYEPPLPAHGEIVFNDEAKWEYDEFSLGAGSVEMSGQTGLEMSEDSMAAGSLTGAGQDDETSAADSEDRTAGRDGQRRSRSRGRRSRNKRRNNAEQEARATSPGIDLGSGQDSGQDEFTRPARSSETEDSDEAWADAGPARTDGQRDTSYSDIDSDQDEDDDLDFADDDFADSEEADQNFRRGKRKMFVSVLPGEEVEVVLSEEGQVHEYYVEMLHQAKTKGNIYKGVINNVDANLQAAFVSYGAVKNGFLQIDEVHPEYFLAHHEAGKGRKFPPIQKVLKSGQEILVQVVKEPTGNKGAFLTSYLSIPGRFLVLTPGREQIGVSRKVDEEGERSRLRGLLEGLNPGPGLGVIVRTVSMGASKTSLRSDLQFLKRLWKDVRKNGGTATAPGLIYQEPDLASRAVRDYLTEEVCEIWVDDESTAEHIRGMAELLYPRRSGLVKLHHDYNQNLWERFNIQKQLDQIQSREVVLPSGGRLVFDQTEALMAIDINTAKATGKSNFESTVLRTNMEAAEIIPRQLKLRDVGGQVVIDFIEMREQSHWRNVEKTLRNAMKTDRARHDVGKISRFGLMEIVRQRLASSAISVSSETCPHCSGTGVRRNLEWQALQSMREINRQMRKAQASNQTKLSYQAEAELALYLLNHKRERLMELEKNYKVHLELQPMPISIG